MHNQNISLVSMMMRGAAVETIKLDNKDVKTTQPVMASNVKGATSTVEEMISLPEAHQSLSCSVLQAPLNSLRGKLISQSPSTIERKF
jgi:hypothetical protein